MIPAGPLWNLLKAGRFEIDGETHIPSCSFEYYNNDNGTDFDTPRCFSGGSSISQARERRAPRQDKLAARIMTLHNDVQDMLYGCRCVYDEAKRRDLPLPLFFKNMECIFNKIENDKI